MSGDIRLNKYLAIMGVTSRRKADELITSGWVQVNNQVVNQLGEKIDPDRGEGKVGWGACTLSNRPALYHAE